VPYSAVDDAVRNWAEANSLTLFDEWAGEAARFVYVSNASGECLQISIEPPCGDLVRVVVTDVETIGGEEVRLEWELSAPEVRQGLDAVLGVVRNWLERQH